MARAAKSTTPSTAAATTVPVNFGSLVPVPAVDASVALVAAPTARVTVTVPLNPGTTLPEASRADTWTGGVIRWPATVVVGCTVNASRVARLGAVASPRQGARSSKDPR